MDIPRRLPRITVSSQRPETIFTLKPAPYIAEDFTSSLDVHSCFVLIFLVTLPTKAVIRLITPRNSQCVRWDLVPT